MINFIVVQFYKNKTGVVFLFSRVDNIDNIKPRLINSLIK